MRRKKTDFQRRVNGDVAIEFGDEGMTSYAGLELLIRYLRRIGFNARVRRHLSAVVNGGDFGVVALCRMILGLLVVGGRRLHHLEFVRGDRLFQRFCGLQHLPGARSVSRGLRRFGASAVEALRQLNAEEVARVVDSCLHARTLTLDVDGTVLCTGSKVGGAARGYNPHHRKVPSYYPVTAFLAESGHLLRLHNRPGNVNDGKSSIPFLQALFRQVEETLGSGYHLRCRMDGDYFKKEVLEELEEHKAGFALKVPFWRCLDLQSRIRARRRWQSVGDGVDGFFTSITLKKWDRRIKVAIYRKRVFHETRKNYQLDLFDPDDGTWEYSAVATNLDMGVRRLWRFMAGRGLHEKIIGELKSALALDTIPTHQYEANSAWQQLVVLAHNLLANFQIETGVIQRPRTHKRTTHWVLRSAQTLRFEIIHRAGRLLRPEGRLTLRLQRNKQVENQFNRISEALAKAA